MSTDRMLQYWQFNHVCKRKQQHASRGAAEAHARALNRKGSDHPVEAYACPFGNHWHVGHRPSKKSRKWIN